MSLKTDVARLERAGSECSGMMEKLRQSVRNLGDCLRKLSPVTSGQKWFLPEGYIFMSWPSGDWRLIKYADNTPVLWLRRENGTENLSRESLLRFSADVTKGWFNEVSALLEKEARNFNSAHDAIEAMLIAPYKM